MTSKEIIEVNKLLHSIWEFQSRRPLNVWLLFDKDLISAESSGFIAIYGCRNSERHQSIISLFQADSTTGVCYYNVQRNNGCNLSCFYMFLKINTCINTFAFCCPVTPLPMHIWNPKHTLEFKAQLIHSRTDTSFKGQSSQ